jgi:hypothetical protein
MRNTSVFLTALVEAAVFKAIEDDIRNPGPFALWLDRFRVAATVCLRFARRRDSGSLRESKRQDRFVVRPLFN